MPALARAVWRDRARRQTFLALLFAAWAAIGFARIAEDYLTNDPLARWDVSFAQWLAARRHGPPLDLFRIVTQVGSPVGSVVVAAIAFLLLYRRRRLADAALLPLLVAGTEALNLLLKVAFHRPRPRVAAVHLDTYSFPSGHAMMATAVYGFLAFVVCRLTNSPALRTAVVASVAGWVCLIAFSRLYLGVHYLSDVLAGIAGGAFCLGLAVAFDGAYPKRLERQLAGSRVDRFIRRLIRV